jgi:hypothetical protein
MPWAGMTIVVPIACVVACLVSGIVGIIAIPVVGLGMAIAMTGNHHAAVSAIVAVASIAAMTAGMAATMMLSQRSAGCQRR